MNGSIVNLASITIERYLKVVHPIWSKKWLRRWVMYSFDEDHRRAVAARDNHVATGDDLQESMPLGGNLYLS